MNGGIVELRGLLGHSAAAWAGDEGVAVEAERWSAISGAPAADYNVILCHGSGVEALGVARGLLAEAGVPGLIMTAGAALGEVQALVAAGWICAGAVPFMCRDITQSHSAASDAGALEVRRLTASELTCARAVVDEAFGIGPELAKVAVPDACANRSDRAVWGLFDDRHALASTLIAVRCETAVAIWSMATTVSARRHGYGARLLEDVLHDSARDGADRCLLYASPPGEPFYRAQGFVELERWQLWSRPRWVLGRV